MTAKKFALETVILSPSYKPAQKEIWENYGLDYGIIVDEHAVVFYVMVHRGADMANKYSMILAGALGPMKLNK